MQFTVSEKCLICSKKFDWNEVIIIKAPEWACFCLKCIESFEDNNKYTWNEAWITTEYRWKEVWTKES